MDEVDDCLDKCSTILRRRDIGRKVDATTPTSNGNVGFNALAWH